MAIVVDSSIVVAFERRRFDLERLLAEHSPAAIAGITAAELLIGVERADTPERRARREEFVANILARIPIIPFDIAQARLFAVHFADLTQRGEKIGDRDLQIAATALSLGYQIATLNVDEFKRVSGLELIDTSLYMVPPPRASF
jgi:predicted nucleic acid-binding protein